MHNQPLLASAYSRARTAAFDQENDMNANFQYAAALTEMAHLGNLALRAGNGKKVEYDPKTMKVKNLPALNAFMKREPRKEYAEFYKGDDVLPQPTPTGLGGQD
jgi:hypothetical protein